MFITLSHERSKNRLRIIQLQMPFRIDFALYDISTYWISLEAQENARRVNIGTKVSIPHLTSSLYKSGEVCHTRHLEDHQQIRDKEVKEEKKPIPRFSNLKRNSMPAPVDICFHRCAHPM